MLGWRSSNVDEMVWVAFAEKGSLSSKEGGHQKVPSVVGLAVVRGGPPLAAVVGVVGDDDGVVPGCLCGGAFVRVVADDDGVVPECPGGGVPQSPAWCSMLQMMAPSKVLQSGRASPMGSVTWRP